MANNNTIESFDLPTECPYCGETLVFDGTHLFCPNVNCDGKGLFKFKDAINILKIKGFGDVMMEDLYFKRFTSPFEIFNKKEFNADMLRLTNVRVTKNLEKVIDKVNAIKDIDLVNVILMLGYKNVGVASAKQIANFISGHDYDFTGLEKEVVTGWGKGEDKREKLASTIELLNKYGLDVTFAKKVDKSGILFEMTGSPKPYFSTKQDFLDKVGKFGYSHTSLKDAKLLVTDDYESTSSKMGQAKKKGIDIVTYEDLAKRLEIL